MSSAKWITCERHGRWAAALRRDPAATGVRIHETRSLDECWEMLAGSPASLIVVELTRANRDGLLHRLAGLERDYPLARVAVVAERSLASWEGLIREAGAAWFCASPRDLRSLASIARRHIDAAPAPPRTFTEQVWADLPWGSGR
ncbi:MAG: hypothetical protein ACLQNE_23435 [Thermoguttaceae bacterium]